MADIRFDWLEDHWVTQYKKIFKVTLTMKNHIVN